MNSPFVLPASQQQQVQLCRRTHCSVHVAVQLIRLVLSRQKVKPAQTSTTYLGIQQLGITE